jgi:anti-sigma regulatory factor (Ser/Thr protein kinase)
MMAERAGQLLPSEWRHAGTRVHLPAQPAGGGGARWLMLTAEALGLVDCQWRPQPASIGRSFLPRVATRTLGRDPGSVRAARDFAVVILRRWQVPERTADIAIVVSELATNALRHAVADPGEARTSQPARLGLLQPQPGPSVLCAVADPSPAVPVPQNPGVLAETGRGLQMIRALSDQWGYTALSNAAGGDSGKVVWALFYPRRDGQI